MNDTERIEFLARANVELYAIEGHYEITVSDDDAEGSHDVVVAKGIDLRQVIDAAAVNLGDA